MFLNSTCTHEHEMAEAKTQVSWDEVLCSKKLIFFFLHLKFFQSKKLSQRKLSTICLIVLRAALSFLETGILLFFERKTKLRERCESAKSQMQFLMNSTSSS